MKIQVLGPGCAKCKQAAETMKQAASSLGLREGKDFEFEKVEKISEIMKYGVVFTPGIIINGKTVLSGKAPGAEEARQYILDNMEKE
ncbi:MAG: thioredoxin family protein [candidate division Zixibacteria bacterium]|nr:thioredoxin family protein [candidate division Zixibacteria bacterium]